MSAGPLQDFAPREEFLRGLFFEFWKSWQRPPYIARAKVRLGRPLGTLAAFGLALALTASSSGLRAEMGRRLRLDYVAEQVCTSDAELMRALTARVPSAVRVVEGDADVTARVEVKKHDGALTAVLELGARDGTTKRELSGADCEELSGALGLMIALALDPDAPRVEPPRPSEPQAPATTLPKPSPPHPKRQTSWLGVGVGFGFASGVAPELEAYEAIRFELGWDEPAWFSPRAGLSVHHARGQSETAWGIAELELFALRVEACPLRLGRTAYAELCATFDAGRLQGKGTHTVAPTTENSPWYGPGGSLGAGVLVLEHVDLRAMAGSLLPLARDRFYFGPDHTAHRVPAVASYFGLAIGARL